MGSIVLKTVILNKYLASLVAFFIYLTFLNKPVGGDEGLFLLQARMLQDGILPVVDYYSKDVPYFLYLYSIIMDIFGSTFVIARVSTYLVGA